MPSTESMRSKSVVPQPINRPNSSPFEDRLTRCFPFSSSLSVKEAFLEGVDWFPLNGKVLDFEDSAILVHKHTGHHMETANRKYNILRARPHTILDRLGRLN